MSSRRPRKRRSRHRLEDIRISTIHHTPTISPTLNATGQSRSTLDIPTVQDHVTESAVPPQPTHDIVTWTAPIGCVQPSSQHTIEASCVEEAVRGEGGVINAQHNEERMHEPSDDCPDGNPNTPVMTFLGNDLARQSLLTTDSLEVCCTTDTSSKPFLVGKWQDLWGLIVTNGSLKLTKAQYQSMRIVADTFRRLTENNRHLSEGQNKAFSLAPQRIDCLPHYSTLFKKVRPAVYEKLAVRGKKTLEKVCMSKAGARESAYSEVGEPLAPVHTILPSEYARADVACAPVLESMLSTSLNHSGDDCVDMWLLVAARAWFYGPTKYLSVDYSSISSRHQLFAEPGDSISIEIIGSTDWTSELRDFLNPSPESAAPEASTLRGTVLHIWTVHHERRIGDQNFEENVPTHVHRRDKDLLNVMRFTAYQSPSDFVDIEIPELPVDEDESEAECASNDGDTIPRKRKKISPVMADAIRRRKAALQQKRVQVE